MKLYCLWVYDKLYGVLNHKDPIPKTEMLAQNFRRVCYVDATNVFVAL